MNLLPEQYVIDCTWGDELAACDGGLSDVGAQTIIERFGGVIPTTKSYGRYLTVDGYCRGAEHTVGSKITGWQAIKARDEEAVQQALLEQPLAVAFNVGESALYYDSGIIDVEECTVNDSDNLNHAINLVGYGTDPDTGLKYWTLRNSWSTYWGDKGYFRVVRGERDCGVTTDAGFPVVEGVGNPEMDEPVAETWI